MFLIKVRPLAAAILCALLFLPLAAQAGPHILVDLDTGRILDEKQGLRSCYPASVTKLMTAYVTFEALKADELILKSPVKISQNALNEPPSKMGFPVGTVITVENALKMVIVKSANDIAVALGEAVAGSEAKFVARMNATARKLGMTGTFFKNPNGLPAKGQMTNVRDMAVLTTAIVKQHPQHAYLFKITAIRAGKRVLTTYNKLLLHYKGTTGMKTGFICSSGFNLVATAKRGDKHLIAIVFGSPSSHVRAEAAAKLLNKGFKKFSIKGRKNIKSFKASGKLKEPKDMRPDICSAAARNKRGKSQRAYKRGKGKSLMSAKRIVAVKPVRVFIGGAVGAMFAQLRNAPLPLARPNVPIVIKTADISEADDVKIANIIDFAETGDGEGKFIPREFNASGVPLPLDRPHKNSGQI
ncbi:MAG: D-alanyl-D-alanine carboxypeptidase [Rhizobiales bacterium]|nr:D-alanyl-D-alanine carboxypeptidase [Hyphomicrobiales bacterium]